MSWKPIARAPRDGTKLLLLYPTGRVDLGHWEYSTRTVNGEVVFEREGWVGTAMGGMVSAMAAKSEPFAFAPIPAVIRDNDGYAVFAHDGQVQ